MNTIKNENELEILKTKSQIVEFPLKQQDKDFIAELYKTISEEPTAVGIAANQIAKTVEYIPSMFLAKFTNIADIDNKQHSLFQLFINPKITTSGGTVKLNEGCLSIPGKLFKKRRYKNVTIEYNDMDGNVFNVKVYGDANFASYIIQHEFDHLQGKLINGL